MFVKPEDVIEKIHLIPGMVAADFGAGAGFYTLAIARRLGTSGKVYALDIRKEMLEIIRSKARVEHLANVEAIWADLEKDHGSHLRDSSVDIVIISNILFQVEKRNSIAQEACRILKPGGEAVIIEWAEEDKPLGPRMKERVNRKDAEDIFLKEGFIFEKECDAGLHHYGLILKKPAQETVKI